MKVLLPPAKRVSSGLLVVVLAASVACSISSPAAVIPSQPPAAPILPTATVLPPTAVPGAALSAVPETVIRQPPPTPDVEALPPEPQPVEFTAEDGQQLKGFYYPAAVNPAPLVVLMHWARGDMGDWAEIAFWLQNRGLGGKTPASELWLDPSWFPRLNVGLSYAVFTFTFRGCEGGCKSFARANWLKDARAAMQTAYVLEGIDPGRIAVAGASIGADGALDGCLTLNQEHPNSCQGAVSFSPGSYLTLPYAGAVTTLEGENPAKPAWCFYSVNDGEAKKACRSASGRNYQIFEYPGDEHGMMLWQPSIEPGVPQLLLDFLTTTLGV